MSRFIVGERTLKRGNVLRLFSKVSDDYKKGEKNDNFNKI